MSEFDVIANYFTWNQDKYNPSQNVIKSVGDDAAVVALKPNQQLVTSIDTLVSGVHFPENTPPYDIGHKSLAVNLSDLAAMGAKPEWFTLALTIPEIDHHWLGEFSRGLKTLAQESGIALVGGDTSSGPLTISIQVMGSVEAGTALFRNGAQAGDTIYVTGTLGDGAAGLASIQNKIQFTTAHAEFCQQRLNRPTPRNTEGTFISPYASACIDLSDGVLQDLSHIIEQSKATLLSDALGAQLDLNKLPFSDALQTINPKQALAFALNGGDDYELLFTVPEKLNAQFIGSIKTSAHAFTCIGSVTNEQGIVDLNNNVLSSNGYNHFS